MKKMLFFALLAALVIVFAACDVPDASCAHNYVLRSETQPTCETNGTRTDRCTLCGNLKKTSIEPIGHNYEKREKAPTCTAEGGEYNECLNCGEKITLTTVEKLAHDCIYTTTEPACDIGGYTLVTCNNCTYSEKTDIQSPLGHSFDDWVTLREPTDVTDGLKERSCTRCLVTESAYITSTSYIDLSLIKAEFDENITHNVATYDELLFKFKVAVINLADSLKCELGFTPDDFSAMLNKLVSDFDSPYGLSLQAGLLGNELTLDFTYSPEPTKKTSAVHYTQYASLNNFAPGSSRAADFDGFKINQSLYTFEVKTTDQLVYALERGVKPICLPGSTAERAYAELKRILINIADDGMSDYEKVRVIHDYLVMNVTYDKELYDSIGTITEGIKEYKGFYLEGVLFDKVAVCEGISKAFTALCNIEGIPCVTVSGYQTANPEGVGHAWNKVYVDGVWYIADATSGGTVVNGNAEILSYQYFLINEETFSSIYIGEDFKNIICTDSVVVYGRDSFNYGGASYDFKIESQSELNALIAFFESSAEENLTVEIMIAFDVGESAAEELSLAYFTNGISKTCGYIVNENVYVLLKK